MESAIRQIRFREREKLPAKTAASLKLRVADYIGRCREIEGALGMRVPFENPVVGRAFRSPADVERAASDVRRAWGLGAAPLTNLLGILEEKGVRVFEVRDVGGFEGLSGTYEHEPFIVVNRDFPADRVRFTAAHELGHILCGFAERRSAESLCHTFAGAFLLPREAAERALMPARRKVALWELKELKEGYGISLQAAMHRARGLGIVGPRQLRNFRGTFRKNGWLVKEPVEYGGKEQTSRLRRLVGYALAERIIGPERAAALLRDNASVLISELGHIF